MPCCSHLHILRLREVLDKVTSPLDCYVRRGHSGDAICSPAMEPSNVSKPFLYDVFISYSSSDMEVVSALAERLRRAGLRVWFDKWCISLGEIVASKVDAGLNQSRVLLLCISKGALSSEWVRLEQSTAIHRDPGNVGRRFIPVLIDSCDVPDTLRRYRYLDLRQTAGSALDELVAMCKPPDRELDAQTLDLVGLRYLQRLSATFARLQPAQLGGEGKVKTLDLNRLYVSLIADPTSFDEREKARGARRRAGEIAGR